MKLSPISLAFKNSKKEKRPALLTYTVAGDNSKKKSLEILKSISKHVDICEIGFPHNTPIADGGQIQTSSYRAIKNGIKIKDVFDIVKKFRNNNLVGLDYFENRMLNLPVGWWVSNAERNHIVEVINRYLLQ